jgi:hypothetical protein
MGRMSRQNTFDFIDYKSNILLSSFLIRGYAEFYNELYILNEMNEPHVIIKVMDTFKEKLEKHLNKGDEEQ